MSVQAESIRGELEIKTTGSGWKGVYILGGVSALIFVVYSLVTMIIVFVIGGRPETAVETFSMLEENRLVGLLRLDALTLLIVPFYYPIYLSICIALRKNHKGFTMLGALLAFAGVTLLLATPSAFPMISLSEKYTTAATAVEKERFLAAGEALLASDMWHGSGALIGGFLALVAALILSIVMLNSSRFSNLTAYLGILTYGLDLARALVSIFTPQIGLMIMVVVGPLYLVWFPLLARDLFRLGRDTLKLQEA